MYKYMYKYMYINMLGSFMITHIYIIEFVAEAILVQIKYFASISIKTEQKVYISFYMCHNLIH